LCISQALVFFLARRFFGGAKQEEWQGLKHSIIRLFWVFGIIFILPGLINLVSSFFLEVVWGSMTLREHSRHFCEFSIQATYNFYADLFAKLPK